MQGIWNLRDSFKATGRMLVLLAVRAATLQAANLAEPEQAKIDRAVDALIGLAAFPAEQALAISLVKRELDTEDLWERKRQIIEQTPGLSVWRGGETFGDLGGLSNVKSFLHAGLAGDASCGIWRGRSLSCHPRNQRIES
jgi:hypothetical protein